MYPRDAYIELRRLIIGARMAITTDTEDDGEKQTARDLLDEAVAVIDDQSRFYK